MDRIFYFIFTIGFTFLLKGNQCFDESIILITDTHNKGLYGVSSKTNTIYTIAVKRILNPIAIHYNEINERIYWSDVMLKEIRSTSINGHDDVIIRSLDNSSIPDGLAVDPVSKLVFYTDAGNHLIALMELDGSNHAVIVTKDIDKPRAIVPDPVNGKIYWSDWGLFPKIETANYDGTNRKAVITSGILWPNALTVDFADQWMYWGDAGTHNIERARLDGSERKVIFYNANSHYFSMLLYSNNLFYTDWQHRSIMAISVSGVDVSSNIGNDSFSRLNDISRLKPKPAYPETNACTKNKGGCSHICIPRPKGNHACLCPTGFTLKDDSFCIKAEEQENSVTCKPLKRHNKFTTISPKECLTHVSPVGKVCKIQCPDGFLYGGNLTDIECKADGHWNADVSLCFAITCPLIITSNTEITGCKKPLDFGSVCEQTCSKGYEKVSGSSFRFCKSDGSWSGEDLKCQEKIRQCGDVPLPKRGYIVSGQCANYYGAKCNIACDTGYQFSSNTKVVTLECDLDENNKAVWKADNLACIPITCPPIMTSNTEITGCKKPLEFGSVCEQTCSKGFEKVSGSNIRSCKLDGSWSGEDLKCQEKIRQCGDVPLPKRGYIVSGQCANYYRAKCNIACDTGYQFSSNTKVGTIECDLDENNKTMWKADNLACNPITCPPIMTSNTEITGCKKPLDFGSVCEQTCSKGFEKVSGSSVRFCKLDGSWSGEDLKCQEKTVECPKLTPYWHSSILGCSPPFIVGSVCAQICHDGYTSDNSGAGQRVCTTDGTWSGQELICVKYETVPPKDSDEKFDFTNSGVLIGVAVIIMSFLLLNCGILVFLRKLGGKIETSVESKISLLQNQNGHSERQFGTSFKREISFSQNSLSDSQPSTKPGVEETFKKEEYT
ncbi:P-selectin-like isoform X2 [Ruditapes philippinarum]|uniref:P-selectin-like isoform X2 n=1 Tax=Ruditapes philippinarum TaxID=129788 RepID=UPI00295B5FD3|nr:P-selectin-like isoform X2 [Ruditapes philippinarum]